MLKTKFFVLCFILLGQFTFLGCNDSSKTHEPVLSEARNLLLSGSYLQAKEKYEFYLQQKKNGKKRWEAWNRLLFINSKLDDAVQRKITILETMLMEFGEDPQKVAELLPIIARAYADDLGEYDKAEQLWKDYLQLCSNDNNCFFKAHLGLAQIYLQQADFSSARENLHNCLQAAKSLADKNHCQYMLARVFMLENNSQKAKIWLQKISDAKADNEFYTKAIFELADLYSKENKYQKAEDLLESILDIHPNPKLVQKKLEHIQRK